MNGNRQVDQCDPCTNKWSSDMDTGMRLEPEILGIDLSPVKDREMTGGLTLTLLDFGLKMSLVQRQS